MYYNLRIGTCKMSHIKYKKRLIETKIKRKLLYSGAVLIDGAKWSGKSTTATQYAKTIIKLQDTDTKNKYKTLVGLSKTEILSGDPPILFDEWQEVPEIWDYIRMNVDETQAKGKFLLTGSTKKQNVKTMHTGTGRINSVMMRPMSLFESGESTGSVSLKSLFEKAKIEPLYSEISVRDIAELICRGGWPGTLTLPKDLQLDIPKDLLSGILREDIDEVDGIKKDKEKLKKIIKSYARNISTLATNKTIYRDQNYENIVEAPTFEKHINALKALYIVEDVPPWSFKIRSSSRLKQGYKKQLVDPSIAVAALDLSPDKLLQDFETFGFFFESIVTRDLRVYSDMLDASVYYYRDSSGLEVDLVLELPDGRWAGVEVKLGLNELDKAAKNLLKLAKLAAKEPEFLMIVTNSQMAYTRPEDGIHVVPLGCLRD